VKRSNPSFFTIAEEIASLKPLATTVINVKG